MDPVYKVASDIHVLPTHLDVPGVGKILVNAFVLMAKQPVLIDTGCHVDEAEFMKELEKIVDPGDLKWIWLTHDDAEHTGNIQAVMARAPQAKLATHALSALRMLTWWPCPLERVHALQLGDGLDVGDRTLRAIRPPVFDNPLSTGLHDEKTGALFSVDSFGAILPHVAQDAADYPTEALQGGMMAWTTFDSPWTHLVDRSLFGQVLDKVRRMAPSRILGSHLPAATGKLDQLLEILAAVPNADPFIPPDAAAFAQIAAAMRARA